MFKKVLIANRGEIAVRIARTLQEMGIVAVAVHSRPDRHAPHVAAADEAHALDGATSAETYLCGDAIIEIARQCGAEAIHPGYGFLAENAAFAQACADGGLRFIGPSPEVIRAMGDKVTARALMEKADVPIIEGSPPDESAGIDALAARAAEIGYPVLVKAVAGGGGKGMRVVEDAAALAAAMEAAQREARASFGDARVFVERYIARGRHVEFQIFGDEHGDVVHLFERECSIQRRHQKIIEEAPAPGLDPQLRRRMGEAAVRAAQAVGYTNAGTVEFIVDDGGDFRFLEVNTRLQVEHPVTELTVHHDLVRAQVLVAAGERLPFIADGLRQTGHAIECRICAEDPSRGFLPSTGRIEVYEPPAGPGIRVDSGVTEGSEISVHYDPMLAKLIVWGRTRDDAIARAIRALEGFVVLGVSTNIEFLRSILASEAFGAGELHTRFLETHPVRQESDGDVPDEALIAAALATPAGRGTGGPGHDRRVEVEPGPWQRLGAWRVV